jgi:uncharacterized protein (TIRG00374 family)
VLRYARWRWLLRRAGCQTVVGRGFLAYLSGFAFTATPGKVGELLRIRYLAPLGVPPSRVLAAFVYERAFDLLAVLVLAALFISRRDVFAFVTVFVLVFVGLIAVAAHRPRALTRVGALLRLRRASKLARLVKTLRDGLTGCRLWFNPTDALIAGGLGLAAWGLTSLSFVYLLAQLGISVPFVSAVATYPLAMLAGAASMIPGGVGSTEVTIVAVLSAQGAPVGPAALAAVGIRLSTLWFSVLCGLGAVGALEVMDRRDGAAHKVIQRGKTLW